MFSRHKGANILIKILDLLKVKYTDNYAHNLYEHCLENNSFWGLSNLLTKYRIENKTIKLSDNEKIFTCSQLVPFISLYNNEIIVVDSVKQDTVSCYMKGKQLKYETGEFERHWSRILLLTEVSEETIEPDYRRHKAEETVSFLYVFILFLFIVCFFIYFFFSNAIYQNWGFIFLFLINFVGVYTSYLLMLKQLHIQNANADKICSSMKIGNCDRVLDSPVAKIFFVVSWSEIGLCYFVSNIIILLTVPSLIPYLAWINICALPYPVWSVWYQKFKLRQWCPLCLIVQLVILLIFIICLLFSFIKPLNFEIIDMICLLGILVITSLIIHSISIFISLKQANKQLSRKYNHLKEEDRVFSLVLQNQTYYKSICNSSTIQFGNKKADILLTMITNPLCSGCSVKHKKINAILEKYNDSICIQYVFANFHGSESLNKLLIWIYQNNSEDNAWRLYTEWFDNGRSNPQKFAFENFNEGLSLEVDEEFIRQQRWIEVNKINQTPIILVNGNILPGYYDVEDFERFVLIDKIYE